MRASHSDPVGQKHASRWILELTVITIKTSFVPSLPMVTRFEYRDKPPASYYISHRRNSGSYIMKFASVISVIATSSVVLALRGRPEDRQTRRRSVTEPWAGAAQQGQGWNFVTGTITVPDVSGQDANRAVAIWVGIDGWSCQNAIWQVRL